MKILLLNPPFKTEYGRFSRTSRSPAITKSGTLYYPLWLAHATGVLEETGFDVKLVDAPAEIYNVKDVIEICKNFLPSLLVIDTSTTSIQSDIKIGKIIKEIFPNIFIVLVGTHPSALPEETLRKGKEIDAIARGEYDYTLRDLATALRDGKDLKHVKGITYRNEEELFNNPKRDFIENLDELPFVSSVYKRHINPDNYFFAAAEYPMMMIISGRGCPFRCFFCVYPQTFHGRGYRLRSADNVVSEFAYIIENFPKVKEVGIEDDTFTANMTRARHICRLLIERGINKKIKWWINVRVNLDLETMRLMKEAGCRLVIPGFESGVQEILDNINKGITLEQSRQFIENTKKAKLLVHGCFMVGNPGETKETMEQTLEFAKELNPDTAQFFPMIPYPGTQAYEWAKSNRFLAEEDFSRWVTEDGLHKCVIRTKDLTPEDILAFCDKARREFYLRPTYLGRKIWQSISSFQEARRNLKSINIFAKHLIH